MTHPPPPIMSDFDDLDELKETQLLELSESEIVSIVELRRARLEHAREELRQKALEEKALILEHEHRTAAVHALEPDMRRAIASTLEPGELANISPYWRQSHPAADAIVCEYERLQKFAAEMEPKVRDAHARWVWLRRTCLLSRPILLEQAESALAAKRAQLAAQLAPQPPRSLLEVAKALVNAGRWKP